MILSGKPYKPLGAPARYNVAPVSQSVLQVSLSYQTIWTAAHQLVAGRFRFRTQRADDSPRSVYTQLL